MKKFIYSAAAMALAFFAASCQQENLEPVATGNTVTYTVQVADVLATKALGDELTAIDTLYYQVYRAAEVNKSDKTFVYKGGATVNAGSASFDLEFVKGQDFVVLFWAQNKGLDMYDITDLRAVTLDTPGASNNAAAQVFAGKDTVTDCVPASRGNVTLYRPISQLNIFTTKESLKFGTKEITLSQSTVKVDGLYTTYNVAAGDAVVTPTAAEFTYAAAAVPATQDTDPYAYVAMNYVGFAPNASTTVQVDFTITTSEGDVMHSVSSVPVKPNYRTNIVGNLLTEAAEYDVTLGAWAREEYNEVVVSTAADLQTTVNEAPAGETTEITLSGDINLGDLAALLSTKSTAASNYLTIPAGKSIVLNLNGYSISGVDETETSFGLIKNHGNLSIVNTAKDKVSKLQLKATHNNGWNRYSSVISSEPLSTLTVGKGVVIEHLGGTDMAYGIDVLTNGTIGDVNVTIDGATVKSTYRAIRQFLNSDSKENNLTVNSGSVIESTGGNKSIWMQDPSAKSNKGSLVVEAGARLMNDVYLTVTAGSAAWPVSVSIADSAFQGEATVATSNIPSLYDVVLKDGIWTVETSFTFAEFVEAVIAAEGTYDGEGKTVKILPLSGKADNTNGCLVPNRLQNYPNPEVYYAQYQRFAELQDVIISNVNFVFVPAAITVQDAWNPAGATTTVENVNGELQFMNSGSVTLTGCTFDKVAVSPINAPALTVADCQFSNLMAYAIKDIKAAEVSITGTEFNKCNGGFWFANAPATVTVTNNTFTEVGRRGAIQFSANGDYSNTTLNISDNIVDGIFLWQLNETITPNQLKPLIESNVHTVAYVEGSVIPVNAAKIGETEYFTLQDAFNVGGDITLLRDITVAETVVLAEGKTVVLDLNGKTLSATDKNVVKNNGGNLTIKNGTVTRTGDEVGYSVNNASGEIAVENATIERGLYTSGSKMTATNANISHEQSTRHAIYAWNCEVTINSGTFHNDNAGNATLMASGSSVVTINGGTFSIADGRSSLGWTSSMIDQNSTAQVLVKGGLFNGGFRINSADTKLTIEGGEFSTNNGSAFTDYSGTKVVKGGKFTDAGAQNWAKKYLADGYILAGDEVKKAYVVNDAASLIETITNAEAGAYIVVENALECPETVSLPANSTLEIKADANIKTLKAVNGGKVLIQDGKTLTLNNFSFGSASTAGSKYEIKGGTVVASYGFFQHGEYALYSNFETGYMYYSYGSDITVYGTFHSQGEGDGLDYVRGKLTIAKGGKSIHDKSLWVGQPASWGAMSASLTIENGGYLQAKTLSVYAGSSMTYFNDADLNCGWGDKTGTITKE